MTATVVRIDQREVVILPVSHQAVSARTIIGASLRVTDMDLVSRQLSAAGIVARVEPSAPRGVTVPPHKARGLWLEFRQEAAQ